MFAETDILPVMPILIPFITAILCLLVWGQVALQRAISVIGSLIAVAFSIFMLNLVQSDGYQVLQMSNWEAPFGISIVVDPFSATMEVLTATIGLLVVLFSFSTISDRRAQVGYYPLVQLLLMGVSGAFITGDVFNLYVWFEVMLNASFVLLALGGQKLQLKGAIKYVTLNLIASAFFLVAVGLLYGYAGSLNMADLARFMPLVNPQAVLLLAILFTFSFGIKAGIFPLYFWLPDSYHTPSLAVTTLFSALLTKVGVYSLVRIYTLLFAEQMDVLQLPLLIIAALTMITGVLGAVAQYDVRRLLSFHIVSQIGYLIMGLALFTTSSMAALVFFIVHVVVAKSGLFVMAGIMYRLNGTYDLRKLGNQWQQRPWLSLLFVAPALALAGLPPFSGFFAKLMLVQAGLEAGQYWIVAVSLAVSVLTLYSMVKIWNECYWKPRPKGLPEVAPQPLTGFMLTPAVTLAVLCLGLGLFAGGFYTIALSAGNSLMTPAQYVLAVLGGG